MKRRVRGGTYVDDTCRVLMSASILGLRGRGTKQGKEGLGERKDALKVQRNDFGKAIILCMRFKK